MTVDEWVQAKVRESIAMQKDGKCCGDDEWRGHLCSYHEGYEDGMFAVIDELERGVMGDETLWAFKKSHQLD